MQDWFASYDPDMCAWKTCQLSFIEELTRYSESFPRAGTMLNGRCYRLRPLVRLTDGIGFSLWPTPQVGMIRGEKYTPETSYKHYTEGRQVHLSQAVRDARMWPTPRSTDGERGGRGDLLAMVRTGKDSRRVQWPTPRTRGLLGGSGSREMMRAKVEAGEASEAEAEGMMGARLWPTPTASQASKPVRNPSPSRVNGTHGWDLQDSVGAASPDLIGGQLNPTWVELLMGFPPGYTEVD